MFCFHTVTRRHIAVFSRNVYHVLGVCCIVFDIDGNVFMFLGSYDAKQDTKIGRGRGVFFFTTEFLFKTYSWGPETPGGGGGGLLGRGLGTRRGLRWVGK